MSEASILRVQPDGRGQYPTIQAAIDAAVDGDSVLLADGTYTGPGNSTIIVESKNVWLASQNGVPDACVIDAAGNSTALGLFAAPGIEGVTIKNASSSSLGTVFAIGEVMIRNCRITENQNRGIYCAGSSNIFTRVTIRNSQLTHNTARNGAGLYVESPYATVTIEDCILENNNSTESPSPYGGGGGAFVGSGANLIARRCLFRGNRSGGGLAINLSTVLVEDCVFSGNDGAAVFVVGEQTYLTLTRSTIAGNFWAGAVVSYGGSLRVANSILWGNSYYPARGGGDIAFDYGTCAVECSDIEHLVDWSGRPLDFGQVTQDPLFCSPVPWTSVPTTEGVYTLSSNSPALHAPCGPMGALGVGCGSVTIQPETWTGVKEKYRK